MAVVLTLDAGTGGAKCVAIDHLGKLRGFASQRWTYHVEANADVPMVKEYAFDPDQFWSILAKCARRALHRVDPSELIGIATTSQREGCVFLDESGAEIYAGPNLDSRGFMEGLEVLEKLGPSALYQITGHSAPFIFPLSRYLWFCRNDSRRVARILMINDWIAYRACGVARSEPSNATESMLFDFRERTWSARILDLFDVPAAILSPVAEPGERIGTVTDAAARDLGVPPDTPVHAGGADTQCALLGAGAFEPGQAAVTLGTTSPVQVVVASPVLDPAENLWAGCHVVPDRWVLESNCGSSGDAYEWFLELLLPGAQDRYGEAEALATSAGPSSTFAFVGPRIFDLTKLRPDLPGAVLFPFPSLQLRPDRGQLLRAMLESIAFAVRANLEQIEAVSPGAVTSLRAGGGMSRSSLLIQLIADVTGLPVERPEIAETTALGCTALVCGAAGFYGDASAAARAMCVTTTTAPVAGVGSRDDARFAKWRELYDAVEALSI